ncbi:hypothetical protein PTI98_010590 [Pleurotus ostreatus]|nr:hypothetical protein PTI98_010590 [Pleurotus ostreatus]
MLIRPSKGKAKRQTVWLELPKGMSMSVIEECARKDSPFGSTSNKDDYRRALEAELASNHADVCEDADADEKTKTKKFE